MMFTKDMWQYQIKFTCLQECIVLYIADTQLCEFVESVKCAIVGFVDIRRYNFVHRMQ